jgi:hypothetical protein
MEMGVLSWINEPAEGRKNHKSSILIFMVDQGYNILPSQLMIIKTISQLKARGVEFCLLHLIHYIRRFQNDWETI